MNTFRGGSRLQPQPIFDSIVIPNLITHDRIAVTEGPNLDLISNNRLSLFVLYEMYETPKVHMALIRFGIDSRKNLI